MQLTAPRTPSTDIDCLDLAAIDRVIGMSDPVQRNLWITYTYHRLELALAERLGGDDLSWCAYGTWASKTAGRFIRGEVVPELLRPLVAATSFRWLAGADAHVRERIAAGNLMVFAELAPCFAALLAVMDRDDPAAAEHLTGLASGDSERGGQDMLRRAMMAYLAAAATDDAKTRSEQILLANTLVAYHEQIRLQETIAAALSAPLSLLVPAEASALRGQFGQRIGQALRALMTRFLMTMELPGARVYLGHDVPALACGAMFPPGLERIELPELRSLLYSLDRTPDTTDGSAATDWSQLGDRMNFVVDLFRSRQRDRSMRLAPFSRDQVAAMLAGRRPSGPL